jgi:hypothetical protein
MPPKIQFNVDEINYLINLFDNFYNNPNNLLKKKEIEKQIVENFYESFKSNHAKPVSFPTLLRNYRENCLRRGRADSTNELLAENANKRSRLLSNFILILEFLIEKMRLF